jgi:tRNA 2-selenouridine synthase
MLSDFLFSPGVIFDVRSPGEFVQGHIPGAINLPLFSNEERAAVGTIYKQQGQRAAISLGLEFCGPKIGGFARQAALNAGQQAAKIYCWRGGMRSSAMEWLLRFSGLSTTLLPGGYKNFRRWVLERFSLPYQLIVIGGMTGSGKTEILHALQDLGEQVIHLEKLANHRGSSFGRIGIKAPQPSTEHFENELALSLAALSPRRPIWIEDESRLIGSCHIPGPFFQQMRGAPLALINATMESRLKRLYADYGDSSADLLAQATMRITKQLGSLRTKEVLKAIYEGRRREAMAAVLNYYDSSYTYALKQRKPPFITLVRSEDSAREFAEHLLQVVSRSSTHVLSEVVC